MTNQEKFIEIMNKTFNAGFTKSNMEKKCSPCGVLKFEDVGCLNYTCDECRKWWDSEYKERDKND